MLLLLLFFKNIIIIIIINQTVVLAEKPPIESRTKIVSDSLLNELIANIGTLASVYYKPASLFGGRTGDTKIFS